MRVDSAADPVPWVSVDPGAPEHCGPLFAHASPLTVTVHPGEILVRGAFVGCRCWVFARIALRECLNDLRACVRGRCVCLACYPYVDVVSRPCIQYLPSMWYLKVEQRGLTVAVNWFVC